MGYFPKEALEHHRRTTKSTFTPLEQIISEFPVRLKQAMLAAAEHGHLRARTWSGCAFNKAGEVAGTNTKVTSTRSAATAFGVAESLVERFINVWDSKLRMDDESRASLLKRCLLNVGVSTPPGKYTIDTTTPHVFGTVVIVETVYKGEQTKFIEALDKAETLEDFVAMGLDEEALDEAKGLVDQLVNA